MFYDEHEAKLLFDFVKLSPEYVAYCALRARRNTIIGGGETKLAELYNWIGDVRTVAFRAWWREYKELFAYPELWTLDQIFTVQQFKDFRYDFDAVFGVNLLADEKQIARDLKEEVRKLRIERGLRKTRDHGEYLEFKWHKIPSVPTLRRTYDLYKDRLNHPTKSLEQLGADHGYARRGKSSAQVKKTVNRKLKDAEAIVRNLLDCRFPDQSRRADAPVDMPIGARLVRRMR